MKKTLVALAALAATGAFAQSSVQIDGAFDAGIVNYNYGGAKYSGVDKNLSYTSQLNLRGTNDLGSGMTGFWHVENDISPVNGFDANGVKSTGATGGFGNGELVVGLTGGFGKVAFGNINNFNLNSNGLSQPFGTAFGSAFGITGGSLFTSRVRDNNTFQYLTPDFSGLKVGVIARPQQANVAGASTTASAFTVGTANDGQSRVASLAALYSAGPINAQFTRSTDDARNTAYVNNSLSAAVDLVAGIPAGVLKGSVGTYTALVGNYNLGATTLYAGYQANEVTNSALGLDGKVNAFNFGAKYVMGANSFMANFAKASESNGGTASIKTLGLGYEYALSKNTAIVARYEKISDGIGLAASALDLVTPAAGSNTDRTRMGAGVRVGF